MSVDVWLCEIGSCIVRQSSPLVCHPPLSHPLSTFFSCPVMAEHDRVSSVHLVCHPLLLWHPSITALQNASSTSVLKDLEIRNFFYAIISLTIYIYISYALNCKVNRQNVTSQVCAEGTLDILVFHFFGFFGGLAGFGGGLVGVGLGGGGFGLGGGEFVCWGEWTTYKKQLQLLKKVSKNCLFMNVWI